MNNKNYHELVILLVLYLSVLIFVPNINADQTIKPDNNLKIQQASDQTTNQQTKQPDQTQTGQTQIQPNQTQTQPNQTQTKPNQIPNQPVLLPDQDSKGIETKDIKVDEAQQDKVDEPPLTPAEELIVDGDSLYESGDFEEAIISWQKAITLLDPKKDTNTYLSTILFMADAYQSIGYHEKAISILDKELPNIEKNSDKYHQVLLLSRLGDVYFSLGKTDKVVDYMLKGIEVAREAENPRLMATILNNIANALASMEHDYKTAMSLYGQALELIIDSENDIDLKSKILLNLLRVELQKGNYEEIKKSIESVLQEMSVMPDNHQKAADFLTLSRILDKARQNTPDADKYFLTAQYLTLDEAKEVAITIEDIRMISYSMGYLGQLYEQQQQYDDAFKLTRSAIFYANQGNYPEILYLWQWQLGRLYKATNNIDEAIKAYASAIDTLNPIRQELFIGYRSTEDLFNANVKPVYLGMAELKVLQADKTPDIVSKESKLKEARNIMEILKTAELEDFFKDECVAATVSHNGNKLDRTPPNTAILYPITLLNELVILLTLPNSMESFHVPVKFQEIKEQVLTYRKGLQNRPNKKFLYDSQKLHDWIIKPLESYLIKEKIDTLVVAPDGPLRLIPFSTLYDGKRFLIERYAISTIPSIGLVDPSPMNKEKFNILLVGLSEGRQGFSPLPSVPAELRDIKVIMDGKVSIQNDQYTIKSIFDEFKKDEYSILHVATHGVFGGTPDESFLLTYESKLNMNLLEELIGLSKYREQKVELLTLSACQTALGNERAALGLAGVAVKAGVKGAIATLWFVDDEATSIAIREFYRQLKTPGLSKAKAMQNVQKQLIAQRRYWHPLYWAPFLVIGNWM